MNPSAFKYLIAISILTFYIGPVQSQSIENIEVMYYNVLNYPNPGNSNLLGDDDARAVYFREIIESQNADIIVMQEVKEEFGVQILINELNSNTTLGKTYATSDEFTAYSGLGNMIIYNDDRINLIDHIEIPRINSAAAPNGNLSFAPRANTRFIIDIESDNCSSELIRLELYSAHFKGSNGNGSSSTVADRIRRDLGAQDLMDYIDTIPLNRNIIFGGDFNFYADNNNGSSNSEPGYITLTNSQYTQQFTDPLGGWVRNTSSNVTKYTQSTRLSQNQYGNGGSSGGLDDRFDMILFNDAITQGNSQISLVSSSYMTVGSSNILNSQAIDGTSPIKNQIQKMSDHYPVLVELELNFMTCAIDCQDVVLNEIHYENVNADVNEFIEVAVPVGAGINIADYDVHLYNGADGLFYDSENLMNFTAGSTDAGFTYYTWNTNIQNGNPDGFALSKLGGHCELLSYGGSFTPNDGPANGQVAIDIGVTENQNTPIGQSLQLIGGTWSGPIPETLGDTNGAAMSCSISNTTITNGNCNGADYSFDVTFTATGASGLYEVINQTNATIMATGTSTTITVTIQNSIAPSSIDIFVRDSNDTSCKDIPVTVNLIDCTETCNGIRINEIAYDNAGGDVNEFIEVAVPSGLSVNLSEYIVHLYNGNGGTTYDSESLNDFSVGNDDGNFIYYTWYPSSIQNGSPDGVSLTSVASLCEFLSYEGTITATNGPYVGQNSTDILVSESGGDPMGNSLQLVNGVWIGSTVENPGDTNVDPNCTVSYLLTGTENGIADYEASNLIESTQSILSTARVDYDSAIEVLLSPTFEVQLGAVFQAFIDGCNNGGGGVN